MINLIIGKKGTGKTKRLVEHANEAVRKSTGNVVVIVKGNHLTYDISHDARLIDIDSYGIQGVDAMEGFLCGICAGNYDVTDIFVDSTLKIIGWEIKTLSEFLEKMNRLSALADTRITLLVSADASTLPDEIKAISTEV
jgi:energy-coupling factor transporter ATP-binding protein EcfA2